MGKLEKLRMNGLGNAAESMGAGVPGRTAPGSALHGATAAGPAAVPVQLQGVSRNKDAAHIPTEKIGSDPTQPREEFDEAELEKLAESLRTRGQLQPITVYWDEARALYVHGLRGTALEGREAGRDSDHDSHHSHACSRGR